MTLDEKVNRITEYYDDDDTFMRQTQEECAELIVALSHFMRAKAGGSIEGMRAAQENICEEAADVCLCIKELGAYFFGLEEYELNIAMNGKADRQLRRIEEEQR